MKTEKSGLRERHISVDDIMEFLEYKVWKNMLPCCYKKALRIGDSYGEK